MLGQNITKVQGVPRPTNLSGPDFPLGEFLHLPSKSSAAFRNRSCFDCRFSENKLF